MIYPHIVENISKLLNQWNMDIQALSSKSGITVNGLKKILANENFRFSSLLKIARALNVPIDCLLNEIKIENYVDNNSVVMCKITYCGQQIIDHEVENIGGLGKGTLTVKCVCNKAEENQTVLEKKFNNLREAYELDQSELINLRTKISDSKEKINFLNEQIEFYKEKAAEYKTFNAVLDEILKKNNEK